MKSACEVAWAILTIESCSVCMSHVFCGRGTMYAYVRFRDDDVKVILSVNQFRNFHPKDLKDFSTRKWYEVFWEDREQSGYYQAQIVRLFGK